MICTELICILYIYMYRTYYNRQMKAGSIIHTILTPFKCPWSWATASLLIGNKKIDEIAQIIRSLAANGSKKWEGLDILCRGGWDGANVLITKLYFRTFFRCKSLRNFKLEQCCKWWRRSHCSCALESCHPCVLEAYVPVCLVCCVSYTDNCTAFLYARCNVTVSLCSSSAFWVMWFACCVSAGIKCELWTCKQGCTLWSLLQKVFIILYNRLV